MITGQKMIIYRSSDKVLNPTEAIRFPIEFLNKITLSGMPDHLIVLKRGMPIMLLSNLDKRNGHANGSRYVVMDMTPKIIYALGIGETNYGKILLIPRISKSNFYLKISPLDGNCLKVTKTNIHFIPINPYIL